MSKRAVFIQGLQVGGGAPVRVESMLSEPLTDLDSCVAQLERLKSHGAELIRVALPHQRFVEPLKELVQRSPLPLMADIHFDPKLAELASETGIGALRLNPGNMGDPSKLHRAIDATKANKVVIRVGANGGSLNPAQLAQAKGDKALALADAATAQIETLLANGAENLILSAKCTDLMQGIKANLILHQRFGEFPFHIGVTESGWGVDGTVKSAIGIGTLLLQGIGDTLRVSLSQDVEDEVDCGWSILRALDIRHRGARLISCPTCGRKQLNTVQLVPLVQPILSSLPDGFTLAVMGCEVNGPGEAKDADLGVAGTPSGLALFKNGKIIARCQRENLMETLISEAQRIMSEKERAGEN